MHWLHFYFLLYINSLVLPFQCFGAGAPDLQFYFCFWRTHRVTWLYLIVFSVHLLGLVFSVSKKSNISYVVFGITKALMTRFKLCVFTLMWHTGKLHLKGLGSNVCWLRMANKLAYKKSFQYFVSHIHKGTEIKISKQNCLGLGPAQFCQRGGEVLNQYHARGSGAKLLTWLFCSHLYLVRSLFLPSQNVLSLPQLWGARRLPKPLTEFFF